MELLTIRLNKIVAKKLMKGAGETLILEIEDFYQYVYLVPNNMSFSGHFDSVIDISVSQHWEIFNFPGTLPILPILLPLLFLYRDIT